jgi:hypothetical protein
MTRRGGLARVVRGPRIGSLPFLRKRTAEDVRVGVPVGVKAREAHEQDEHHPTREGERHVVAEKAATQIAARTRLIHGPSKAP